MKLQAIKILSDENISSKVVAFLRQAGVDVRDVKEEQWFVTGDGVGWVVMQVIEVGW